MNKLSLFLFLFIVFGSTAQNAFTLSDAEQQLQKQNLQLLAEYYNVTAYRAAIIQAKIWQQPYALIDVNAYNPEANRFFDVGPTGQKSVSIEQLIYIGGKKKNEIKFAKSNAAIAELQFEQLLRALKFQLSQHFFAIHFEQQKVSLLEKQIGKLDTLARTYQLQADKGNIPLKEVVRLQVLLLSLQNDKNSSQKEIISDQENLKLLIGSSENIVPVVTISEVDKFNLTKLTKDELIQSAVLNPEYLIVSKVSESQELFVKWQRSLSAPDLTAGVSYDQRSGAFNNQVNVALGVQLPVWNKNKGNIKIAQAEASAAVLDKDYKKMELENKIVSAWEVWKQQQEQVLSIHKSVGANLELVYKGMIDNFQKRNITSLEFTDFMESYNQSTLQLNEIKKQLIVAGINLNYVTNTEVF